MPIYGYLLMASDAVLILGGVTMYWFSPRIRRNWVLGYGSPRSMINDATWQSGNRFAGTALALMTLVAMFVHVSLWRIIGSNDVAQALATASILSLPFFVMFLTERYLARVFRN
jgi:uncharacterized membrane protein